MESTGKNLTPAMPTGPSTVPWLTTRGTFVRPREADLRFSDQLPAEERVIFERITRNTGMFCEEEVQIALELFDTFQAQGVTSGYHFLAVRLGDQLVGYSCFGPIPATDSSFDLYWIVLDRSQQRKGLGRAILEETERNVRLLGGTQLYVDTAGKALYLPTRSFYAANNYETVAVLRDFYAAGDDKIIFCKRWGS